MADGFKTYTKFQRHVNNANEIIDAEHINKVQEAVNTAETNIATLADTGFQDKALFTFDNNLYCNSIFIDELKDTAYIDFINSKNIEFNTGDMSIQLKDGCNEGYFVSTVIQSEYNSIINDFILMSDTYIPLGAEVKYFLIDATNGSYPITGNTPNIPCNIKSALTTVTVKIELRRNSQMESPKLYAYALMYFDYILEGTYGMINPDLRRFTNDSVGTTIMVRDRAHNDRLVRVIEPETITELYYDDANGGRLDYTLTTSGDTKVKDALIYEPYLNSSNKIETVLTGIKSECMTIEDSISPNLIFEDGEVTTS